MGKRRTRKQKIKSKGAKVIKIEKAEPREKADKDERQEKLIVKDLIKTGLIAMVLLGVLMVFYIVVG